MGTFFCPYIKPLSIDGKQWNDTARRAERGGGEGDSPMNMKGRLKTPRDQTRGPP